MKIKKPKTLSLIILGGVFVLAATAAIIWGPGYLKTSKIHNERTLIKTAERYFVSSDTKEVRKAIPVLEKVLKSSSSKAVEAQAKILLARTYLKIEDANPLFAAKLLKEVALGIKYPLLLRAEAVRYGADMCDEYGEQFIKENVVLIIPPKSVGSVEGVNICDTIRNYSAQLYKSVKL